MPGLEDRLMEGSDEEVAHVGELVRANHCILLSKMILTLRADTEGRFQRKVRRYQELERRDSGLDHPTRPAFESFPGTQRQGRSWIPP
jgi:hypothetical protein